MLFTREQYTRVLHWNQQCGQKWKSLTNREKQTAKLLIQGMDNSMIATKLSISINTAAYHISNIIHKLGVRSRQEAASWIIQHIPDPLANLKELID